MSEEIRYIQIGSQARGDIIIKAFVIIEHGSWILSRESDSSLAQPLYLVEHCMAKLDGEHGYFRYKDLFVRGLCGPSSTRIEKTMMPKCVYCHCDAPGSILMYLYTMAK